MASARTQFDALTCPRVGCKAVIRALTGLQELEKLCTHYRRVHGRTLSTSEALDLRAAHESGLYVDPEKRIVR